MGSYFDALAKAAQEFVTGKFGDRSYPDAAFVVEKGAEKDEAGKTLQRGSPKPRESSPSFTRYS